MTGHQKHTDQTPKLRRYLDVPSLKLTFSHLKMDGWNTILSFWDFAYFQVRLLLVLGRV